jgi:hypothetical protein
LNCAEQIELIKFARKQLEQAISPTIFVAQNDVETCINLTYIHLSSALAQRTFIASLPTNKSYMKYYKERTHAKRQELDTVLQNCNHERWQRMMMLLDLTKFFMKLPSYALVKMLH